ncbi:MAG TPA: type II toxin-antitoxin system prevent-host-death family antitoxin [Gemmatimonadaceae bacterium]|nr:type II toxin-antitoxin system prevent-host-death family antitoxin [Gemmatimonadaceae bacterium]
MTTTSISELKARLSAYLDIVRQGDEVLVTDRGRVIARLAPVGGKVLDDSRRDALIRSGRMRPATARLPRNFWAKPRPRDADGRSLSALLDERAEGW